ncbi:PotD/PotF family extracellular solute-binding protein [Mangrovicoccus sp. HB161399]|uniref:ABC transporter substrate-binding protein n=1 Tax=Mangrovicoccus sp. HB161399 TaxID=2720392 RepID=UPI0015529ACF|nr:extracellular solute-binding protein [Mangrovicoccus sp. HB161399]
MTRDRTAFPTPPSRPTRRRALKLMAGGTAMALAAPYCIRPAEAQENTLRALMWEGYALPEVIAAFEEAHGVRFTPTFFDGNSEAYNKLRVGGSKDFDLVQADGFWPGLYYREGLIRSFDFAALSSSGGYFPTFKPETFELLMDAESGDVFGAPFCWGSYGITYNADAVPAEKAGSLELMFDPDFAGRLSTSARFEENIAMAGILVAERMGTKDAPRPDGKSFNPYVLTDEELAGVEALLIEQKRLLLTRYQDNNTLRQLLAGQAVVAAPEFAQVYRLLRAEHDAGNLPTEFDHQLVPKEGGLGWVDTWLVTSGVEDGGRLELATAWIDMITSPEVMKKISLASGCSTTVDIRSLSTPEEQALFLMDRTAELEDMYMFDQPSSTEKWERVWSNMQAA